MSALEEVALIQDPDQRDRYLEGLWDDLSDVPFDESETDLVLAEEWEGFPAGTERETIWRWFDDYHSTGVYSLMFPSAMEPASRSDPTGYEKEELHMRLTDALQESVWEYVRTHDPNPMPVIVSERFRNPDHAAIAGDIFRGLRSMAEPFQLGETGPGIREMFNGFQAKFCKIDGEVVIAAADEDIPLESDSRPDGASLESEIADSREAAEHLNGSGTTLTDPPDRRNARSASTELDH